MEYNLHNSILYLLGTVLRCYNFIPSNKGLLPLIAIPRANKFLDGWSASNPKLFFISAISMPGKTSKASRRRFFFPQFRRCSVQLLRWPPLPKDNILPSNRVQHGEKLRWCRHSWRSRRRRWIFRDKRWRHSSGWPSVLVPRIADSDRTADMPSPQALTGHVEICLGIFHRFWYSSLRCRGWLLQSSHE